MEAPLKWFGQERAKADNKLFTDFNGFPFIIGQEVYGTWVNGEGYTFYMEGKIDYNENSGYWVVDSRGGITPVSMFWQISFRTEFLEDQSK
jgi:hypothetical protein